jgi:hypothetical protein
MPTSVTAEQGDCILSLSREFNIPWHTVWNDPANANLKKLRRRPTILLPGDVVVIPDKQQKQEDRSTDASHDFQVERAKAMLCLQLFEEEKPRANQQFRILVDGVATAGATDDQGKLEVPIPFDAQRAQLRIGPDAAFYALDLGFLDPITETSGLQGRLQNLGYYYGEVDGIFGDITQRAITLFQLRFGLQVTGQPDSQTLAKIEEIHDTVCLFPPMDDASNDAADDGAG